MDTHFLAQTALFAGCSEEEITHMMTCLQHEQKSLSRGQLIYRSGQTVKDICLVLSGSVQIESIDVFGTKSILGISGPGDLFAEAYACLPDRPILVDAVAREDTELLLINIPALFAESASCIHSTQLLKNLLRISSEKNRSLSMRIFHSAPKTIRARLCSYFSEQISLQGSPSITIPLDRQQLADYLGVDRTALSKELGRMRDEGLLTFRKNHFHITIGGTDHALS